MVLLCIFYVLLAVPSESAWNPYDVVGRNDLGGMIQIRNTEGGGIGTVDAGAVEVALREKRKEWARNEAQGARELFIATNGMTPEEDRSRRNPANKAQWNEHDRKKREDDRLKSILQNEDRDKGVRTQMIAGVYPSSFSGSTVNEINAYKTRRLIHPITEAAREESAIARNKGESLERRLDARIRGIAYAKTLRQDVFNPDYAVAGEDRPWNKYQDNLFPTKRKVEEVRKRREKERSDVLTVQQGQQKASAPLALPPKSQTAERDRTLHENERRFQQQKADKEKARVARVAAAEKAVVEKSRQEAVKQDRANRIALGSKQGKVSTDVAEMKRLNKQNFKDVTGRDKAPHRSPAEKKQWYGVQYRDTIKAGGSEARRAQKQGRTSFVNDGPKKKRGF